MRNIFWFRGGFMSQEFDCNYGEEEFSTIKAGIEAIEAVLAGEDIHAKERLLYCLDWYMDPYYQKNLSEIQEPLIELLQKIAVSDDDIGIVDEAFHLLEAYTEGPYEILERNMDSIPEEYKPTALYLINTNNK